MTSADVVSDLVGKEVLKKVCESVDMEALAKRIGPKLEKAIEKEMLELINDGDFMYDVVSDSLDNKAFTAIKNSISKTMVNAFRGKAA